MPGHCYHVTFTTASRAPFFLDRSLAGTASAALTHPDFLGTTVMLAWVLMPDHAHLLLQLGSREPLARVANRLKSASARKTNAVRGKTGALWSPGYYDHAMRVDEDLRTTAEYILANPVRAGLVERIEEYPFKGSLWAS